MRNHHAFLEDAAAATCLAVCALALAFQGQAAAESKPSGDSKSGPASLTAGRSVKGMKLKVSSNGRYFVDQDGKPFFYLGDTAWLLFQRFDHQEVDEYLKDRAGKGFTVIQAYVLRGLGARHPDGNSSLLGETPLIDRDPARPNEAFFKNVDHVINRANELGLVMGLVVAKSWHVNKHPEHVFDAKNAYTFGRFLGERYKNNAVLWYVGGDSKPGDDTAPWVAMAKGLKDGCGGSQLVSYHGSGRTSSSMWFHKDNWLDFNSIQSGHGWAAKTYGYIIQDYGLSPAKPTVDMEPPYENHPTGPNTPRIDSHQVRKGAYWNMLAGAAGHGYGALDLFWLYKDSDGPFPRNGFQPWRKALAYEGSRQVGFLRRLFELRPWYKLVPDQSVIASGQAEGEDHIQAARADDGSFLIAYLPHGKTVGIHMDKISGKHVKARWYDPREGTWREIGESANAGVREFAAPSRGEKDDWVLVLEDAGKGYPVKLGVSTTPASRAATVRVAAAQAKRRAIDWRLKNPADVLAAVDKNLAELEKIVQQAGEQKCDALALPEDTLGLLDWYGMNENVAKEVLPEAVKRMLDRLGRAAAKHRMYLVCCSDSVEADGATYNTAFFLGRDGQEIGRYHKVCPTWGESGARKRGQSLPVFKTPDLGTVGLLICNDLKFGETARCLALQGADIIFFPTMAGATYSDAELAVQGLRVRAVDNFVYLVVAQRGGGALVISPHGKFLAKAEGIDGLAIADLDPFGGREGGDAFNVQKDMRARLFRERNPDAFTTLTDPNPLVLAKVPIDSTQEEAGRLFARALTVGEEEFNRAAALVRAGTTMEAIDAFEKLRSEYPGTWIDRVARERLKELRAGQEHGKLPEQYFRLLEAELALIEKRLDAGPKAALGLNECPGVVFAAAVLYAKQHAANPFHGDQRKLALALRIGDLLADGFERGEFQKILNDDWGTYMWLDAFRLLEKNLGTERAARWRKELARDIQRVFDMTAECIDFPRYQAPFIRTSTNHYSLRASTVHLAGQIFRNRDWESLGARAMHRLAAAEQTTDGYWGEHTDNGPETGYNYLTLAGVALYWEHSRDKAALEALRRATDFHKHFTYPDGTPVETINGRNRRGGVSPWSHFAFSHFPEGRRYAEFLTGFFQPGKLGGGGTSVTQGLGRIAQNALYYHEGPTAPIPQDLPRYAHQMKAAAGIRKTGPWVVCLSGLTDAPADANQFFLDRQGHLSIFHEKLGLIVTGANSKRQPELATFTEKVKDKVYHLPLSGRLRMDDERDRLALAYNSFFAALEVPPPTDNRLELRLAITPTMRVAEAHLTLQMVLKAGQALETGSGRRVVLGESKFDWGADELGGWIRHNGWTLKLPPTARLAWPVYPFNPYANGAETRLEHAVGALSMPLSAGEPEGRFILEVD